MARLWPYLPCTIFGRMTGPLRRVTDGRARFRLSLQNRRTGQSAATPAPGPTCNPLVKGIFHRSEEHTSELQSLMRISYAVFCLKKKNKTSLKIYTLHFSQQ